MKKRVLFIGGSRFVGRVFNILASKDGSLEPHVVNRGRYPLGLEGVFEYKCDRRAGRMMARLLPDGAEFDACIDTCAGAPGDIRLIIDAMGARIRHYIFISSGGVYDPALCKVKTEDDPLPPPESVPDAARVKIMLERELREACGGAGIPYTVLRPAYIYGPLNYLPRESWFIEMIARRHTVPVPLDATASFNFVYVKDVARALMAVAGDGRAYDETFNLAAPERVTYTRLISDFERLNGGSFDTREMTVAEICRENIPMPFPMTEDDLTDGEKFARTFGFQYLPFAEGMEATFNAVYALYR